MRIRNYYKHKGAYKILFTLSIIGVIALYIGLRAQGASHDTSVFLMFLMFIFG